MHGGPLAPPDGMRTETLRLGDRAPDAELLNANGTGTRLFDLLRGPDFPAIAYDPGAARDLEQLAWPSAGAQLKRLVVEPVATDGSAFMSWEAWQRFTQGAFGG